MEFLADLENNTDSEILEKSNLWIDKPIENLEQIKFPLWYDNYLKKSWDKYVNHEYPSIKNQNWRFSNFKKGGLFKDNNIKLISSKVDSEVISKCIHRAIKNRPEKYLAHYVFVNNELVLDECKSNGLNLICLPFRKALLEKEEVVKKVFDCYGEIDSIGGEKMMFLNQSCDPDGVFIFASNNCNIKDPIIVNHFIASNNQATFSKSIVFADNNSSLNIFETFESAGDSKYIDNISLAETIIESSSCSNIEYISLQNQNIDTSRHFHFVNSNAKKDSTINSFVVNIGSNWVRNEFISNTIEPGSTCNIFSSNLSSEDQEFDQRTLQNHYSENTNSRLLFKNSLYDKSKNIFSGLINVRPKAHFSDSYQTCHNLINNPSAESNSMPGLKIDADQVKCSHGSTSSSINKNEIFYLQSRGISEKECYKIINLGFLTDSLSNINNEEIKDYLITNIINKLDVIS